MRKKYSWYYQNDKLSVKIFQLSFDKDINYYVGN